MMLEPRRCHKCSRWMEFEMSYLAGNPIVIWRCEWCRTSSFNESTIATNHTIYVDEGNKAYYVDTTNAKDIIWGGKDELRTL